jgi:hypothetical protein
MATAPQARQRQRFDRLSACLQDVYFSLDAVLATYLKSIHMYPMKQLKFLIDRL